MQRTRLLVLVFSLTAFMAMSVARADGPGGSSEHQTQCKGRNSTGGPSRPGDERRCQTVYTNNVTCGDNVDVAGLDVFLGPGGAEVCNDDDDLPLQGRVMVSVDAGSGSGFAGADGDADNPVPADGWIGVSTDSGTPLACGQRGPDGTPTSSLDHANENDDVGDCAGI